MPVAAFAGGVQSRTETLAPAGPPPEAYRAYWRSNQGYIPFCPLNQDLSLVLHAESSKAGNIRSVQLPGPAIGLLQGMRKRASPELDWQAAFCLRSWRPSRLSSHSNRDFRDDLGYRA